MGKVKKKSKKAPRRNPISPESPPSEDREGDFFGKDEDEVIESTIAKLKSAKDTDREVACENVSMFSERYAERILQTEILRILSPLVIDPNENVRRSAIGALKNLSISSSEEENARYIREEMIKADVLTPLLALFERLASTEFQDEDTFIQAVNLLWNLCETSDLALEVAFKKDDKLLDFLLGVLSGGSYRIREAALQCLLTVTEDNPRMNEKIRNNRDIFRNLASYEHKDEEDSMLQNILACGILLNVLDGEDEKELRHTLEVISRVLERDHRSMITEYGNALSTEDEGRKRSDKSTMETEGVSYTLEKKLISLLASQQTALEILTNLCCDREDDEEWGDMEDEDDSDQFEESNDTIVEMESSDASVPILVQEAIKSHQLLDKILQKAVLPPLIVTNMLKSSTEGKSILKMNENMRSKSFLCFNNVLTSGVVSIEDLANGEDKFGRLFEIWTELGTLCFGEQGEKSLNVLESATSALRALTQRLSEASCPNFTSLSLEDIRVILGLSTSSSTEVRINVVHIAGSLGVSGLGKEILQGLTEFLLETAHKDRDVSVSAEALDKIFDLYSEDDTDPLAVEISLINRLKGLSLEFRAKVSRLKKKDPSNPVVHTVKANLNRFIKYKSKRPLIAKSL